MTDIATFNADLPENVVDFTAYKLQRCIEAYRTAGNENAIAFEQALTLYYLGRLCIEWIDGHPFAIVLDKEAGQVLLDNGGITKKDLDAAEEGEKDENENPNDSE
jgi:hypothetical protein